MKHPPTQPGTGKTALITGASAGIGYALATLMAEDGWQLILVARRGAAMRSLGADLKRRFGTRTTVLPADLGRPDAANKLVRELTRRKLVVDALVNNAGFGAFGPFHEISAESQLGMIQVNVTALVHLTRLILPGMVKRRRGRILNVASLAAFQPGPFMTIYYATKAFVLSFSEGLTEELRGTGITVTALCPGPVESEFGDRANKEGSRKFGENPLARATSAEIAAAGYRAMLRGTPILVPGLMNKIMRQGVRIGSRNLIRRVVRFMQARRLEKK